MPVYKTFKWVNNIDATDNFCYNMCTMKSIVFWFFISYLISLQIFSKHDKDTLKLFKYTHKHTHISSNYNYKIFDKQLSSVVTFDDNITSSLWWICNVNYVALFFTNGSRILFNNGRLDNLILESIVKLKEPKGSDMAAIAAYIEVFLLW
jgi:hypothetical protein